MFGYKKSFKKIICRNYEELNGSKEFFFEDQFIKNEEMLFNSNMPFRKNSFENLKKKNTRLDHKFK